MSQGMESVNDCLKGKDSVAKEQKKNPLEEGKLEWGNFTVFRKPIKHNKICPKKGTQQSKTYRGH